MNIWKRARQFYVIQGIIAVLSILLLLSLTGAAPVLHLIGYNEIDIPLFVVLRLMYWVVLAFVFFYCYKIESRPLLIWEEQSIKPLKWPVHVILIYISLIVGLLLLQKSLAAMHLFSKSEKQTEIVEMMRDRFSLIIFTSLTAAVVEEFIFRGYILTRLAYIFNSPTIGILLSSLTFGLLHYKYGTVFNVVGPLFIGAVFGFHYYKYRNIKMVILCHFLWDSLSMILLLYVKQPH